VKHLVSCKLSERPAAELERQTSEEIIMSEPWSIYIDIEGFSALWERGEDQIIWSLGELMRAIFRTARSCYPREPDRLFAHQFGDGFLIVSDFHEISLERCAAIAVALMRHVAGTGRLTRAAISEGELSDIQGCYPKEVLECLEGDHTVDLHMGLMTIVPVMGTALIRAVGVDKIAPRGPLLTIHSSKASRLGSSVPWQTISGTELVSIDWVHMQSDLLAWLLQTARLKAPSNESLEKILSNYCKEHSVRDDWRKNVHGLLHVPHPSDA
jgi:hypothetical protein